MNHRNKYSSKNGVCRRCGKKQEANWKNCNKCGGMVSEKETVEKEEERKMLSFWWKNK